jgi:hypothetical protein
MMPAVDRRIVLWTLVVFFGASIVFRMVNDATEGEAVAVRLGFQVLAMAAIIAVLALIVRRRG